MQWRSRRPPNSCISTSLLVHRIEEIPIKTGTFVHSRPLASPSILFQNGYYSGYSERPMAKEKLLTEANCKAAKASTKMYYLNDGGGLRLRVQTNGSRNWLFRYKVSGKEKTAGLGAYPQSVPSRSTQTSTSRERFGHRRPRSCGHETSG